MWVYEENFEGRLLSEWINTFHVNQKYLPGITLPNNVHAYPDLLESVKGASLLVFVLPHQVCKYPFTFKFTFISSLSKMLVKVSKVI